MDVRVIWFIDNELVSDRLITNKGLEAFAKILAGVETVSSWSVIIGSDPSPEDIYDEQLYDQKLSYTPTITYEVTDTYSRIRFDATAPSADLNDIIIGELGLLLTTNVDSYLVDRTSYTPTTFTTSKTFTCIIELRRW